MATNRNSPPKVQRNFRGFTTVLQSAACEWFLIFLLLIDAALSYLLTRFAQYCELKIPCILCSRLDHVFGNEKPGFYRNLLCSHHRSEISSLISCNIHGKLVDVHGMCEHCLTSYIEENKSNSDMQRLFLGILGFDPAGFGNRHSQSSFFNRDPASQCTRLCICCNEPWIARPNAQRLLPLKSPGIVVERPNIPLPRRLSHQNGLKKIRDKFLEPEASHLLGQTAFDPLPHVGYTKLKITSESESEVPFSDDENGSSIVRDMNENKKEFTVHSAPESPPKGPYNNLATTEQHDANEPHDVRCLAPYFCSENDACECKEQLTDQKTNPSQLPELISLDDISPSSSFVEVPSFSASLLSDLISLVDIPPSVDVKEVPLEAFSEKLADVSKGSKSENISINKNDEISKSISTSTSDGCKTDRVVDDTTLINSIDGNLNAVDELAVSGEGKSASGCVGKQPVLTYNNGVNEYLKSLPVQNSSGQGIHLSLNNLSPALEGHSVELQRTNGSNSDEVQNIQNLVFMEGSDSTGLECLDGSSVSEIDGENLVDRLKRQVEYDRKCMNALYKELEEERSASAIAANQAMAMITKLQEEKATLHMEALQYLRMMEEQSEYDVDALEKANDLLAEKEKELQDLEAELEYYRLNFPDGTPVETVPDASINLKEYISVKNTSTSSIKEDLKFPSKTICPEASEVNDNPAVISAWSEFEDEKLYISQCLQNLEKKLKRLAHQGTSPYISDGEYFDEAADGGQHQLEFHDEKDKQVMCQVEGNDLSVHKESSMSNGTAPSQERLSTSIRRGQMATKAKGHTVSNESAEGSLDCRGTGLAALENEISDLNERLEALEADCNFLEHSVNSLQNGNQGLLFIQEIIHQLRELRKPGIRSSVL